MDYTGDHMYKEDGYDLPGVSIYNMDIMDAAQVKNIKPTIQHGERPNKFKLRPSSATNKKTRPHSGAQAKRLVQNHAAIAATTDYSGLILSGYTGHTDRVNEEVSHDGVMSSLEYREDSYYDIPTDERTGVYSHTHSDGGVYAPCGTPAPPPGTPQCYTPSYVTPADITVPSADITVPSADITVPYTDIEQPSDGFRSQLSLALPGVGDLADSSDDEEIPTLRLLDGLHINLSGGTASVAFTKELKSKLQSDQNNPDSSANDDTEHSLCEHTPSQSHTQVEKTVDERRAEMELEIQAILSKSTYKDLSKNKITNNGDVKVTRSSLRDADDMRESRDCWGGNNTQIEDHLQTHLERGSNSKKGDQLQTQLMRSSGSRQQLRKPLKQQTEPQIGTEELGTSSIISESRENGEPLAVPDSTILEELSSQHPESDEEDVPLPDLDLGDPPQLDKVASKPHTPAQESFLYKWQINVADSKQIPELSIPLTDKRRDFDAIDDEIDQRVEEIERQLAQQIKESQKAIERLENQAGDTEFRIPKFCEIDNEPSTGGDGSPQSTHELLAQAQARAEAKVRAHSRATSSRVDYNVIQNHQANKLGLKNRDVSNVFTALTPRHRKKYTPTITGKVYLNNVKSRINSGVSRKKKSVNPSSSPPGGEGSNHTELVLNGNADLAAAAEAPDTRSVRFDQPHRAMSKKSSSVTEQKQKSAAGKVIKTFTFSQGGDLVEDKAVSNLTEKSTPDRYQVPDHVKAHMDKCVTKPPKPTNQSRPRSSKPSNKTEDMSSNHITPLSHVTISAGDTRRQRIRSAPVRRASGGEGRVLTRERSQERKLSSGFTSDHHINKNPSPEHKQTDKTKYKPEDIITAMAMMENDDDNDSTNNNNGAHMQQDDSPSSHQGGLIGGTSHQGGLAGTSHQGGLAGTKTTRPLSATSHGSQHPTSNGKDSSGRPARVQSAPVRRVQSSPTRRKGRGGTIITPYNHIDREDQDQLEDIDNVYDKMTQLGVNIRDKSTIDRALYPPPEQPVKSCQKEFSKRFFSSGLLSSPEKWLKEEHKKLKEAQRNVKRCEEMMKKQKKV